MYDDIDSDIVESAIIIGLVATLAILVYYRNQRQANAHRQQQQQQQQQVQAQAQAQAQPQAQGQDQDHGQGQAAVPGQQADGGFFPPPGDPNHGQWVAGGVGH